MRRNVKTCIEGSKLSEKIENDKTLGIQSISLTGYDLEKLNTHPINIVLKEQKKAALIVMSKVCSEDFSSVSSAIAN
jgi:hypothetical protein